MATPVVHDGVPVAIREREDSLKHSEEEKQLQVFFLSLSSDIWKFYQLFNKQSFLRAREDQNTKEKNVTKKYPNGTRDGHFSIVSVKMHFYKMNVSM